MAVALRKESVDRNSCVPRALFDFPIVALRKESVDRNPLVITAFPGSVESLSARRAWIEILPSTTRRLTNIVALRKESVDRNTRILAHHARKIMSLSARRAWIEIDGRV